MCCGIVTKYTTRERQAMGHKEDYDERFEKQVRALGFAVLNLQKANEKPGEDGSRITDIRFKLDADSRTSVLVVIKAESEGDAVVGFAGGPDLATAILSTGSKLARGVMKWREDRPWAPA